LSKTAKVVVRPYRDEDFSQVMEIAMDLLVENRERVEGTIRMASRSDAFKLFIAETDGMVVGFLMLELKGWNKDLAQIYWMAVRGGHQRKGYGSTLIKEMEHYAKEKGVRKIFIGTNSDNKIAIPFYVKNGYKPEGLLKDWDKDGEDCLILGKHL
jgi:ribosomal protein S18 acetylase RimI-like enzyme